MSFNSVWFILIAVLWIGYFILEGFDFGVGILLKVVAKNQAERRAVLTTLGPLWDGNEVWLLVAEVQHSLHSQSGMRPYLAGSIYRYF